MAVETFHRVIAFPRGGNASSPKYSSDGLSGVQLKHVLHALKEERAVIRPLVLILGEGQCRHHSVIWAQQCTQRLAHALVCPFSKLSLSGSLGRWKGPRHSIALVSSSRMCRRNVADISISLALRYSRTVESTPASSARCCKSKLMPLMTGMRIPAKPNEICDPNMMVQMTPCEMR